MPDHQPSIQPKRHSSATQLIFLFLSVPSLLLLVFITLCYIKQFDACAAVTVYPSWVWFAFGLFCSLLLIRNQNRRTAISTLCPWFIFLVVFADTPLSLWRGLWAPSDSAWITAKEQGKAIRVISLNCSSSKKSILAMQQWNPDLILIQESPGIETLNTIADKFFGEEGDVLFGVDASIITRGKVQPLATSGNDTIGKITLPTGREIAVVSLRLSPPPFRFDLWSPDCWRAFRNHRVKLRADIVALRKALAKLPADLPLIVGGDFNANPRDAIFAEFPASLHDTFSIAGSGWGNTITNDVPFLRIDQIWINGSFQPVQVVSEAAIDTDHRSVIADLILKQ